MGESIFTFRRRIIAAALLFLMTPANLFAVGPRSFDIGAGNARSTLREFARQAKVSVVLDRDKVKGVQTNEVSGLLVPKHALERMLEGTPLVFNEDLETGAFAVTRSKEPIAELTTPGAGPQGPDSERNPENTTLMNEKKNTIASLIKGLLALAVTGAPNLSAQDDTEEVFELSPFQVDGSNDTGYVATSTLAGTRIRTDLKDLGAAISVYTSEFLEDTGATDASTLLSYTSNTEVGGHQGNFSGAEDSANGRFFQRDERTNPQSNQRIRGMGRADLTRGYFLTDIPFDSYNTDRVTVSRGPNSLLFGIGNPGGVVNNATKQAVHSRNFGEVSAKIDNYGTHRVTLDYNRVLVEDRVALRLAVLNQNQKYKQDPTFEKQTRYFGDLDIVLSKNENSNFLDTTRLSINGEVGDMESLPVEVVPPSMAFHGWFEPIPADIGQYSGSNPPDRVVSPSEGGAWEFQTTYNPFQYNSEGDINTNTHPSHFRLINQVYNRWDSTRREVGSGDGLGGYQGILLWNSSDTYESAGLAGTPGVLAAGITDPTTPIGGRTVEYHTNSPYAEGYAAGFAVPTLQNTDIFDYRNHIYSGDIDRVYRDFDVFNIAFEQNLFNNKAGIEVAYDRQNYDTFQDFYFTGGGGTSTTGPYDIYVTIAEYLPNGQPHPNLGRAYTRVSTPKVRYSTNERETFRFTAFGEVDFTERDGFLKNLGTHRFTGLYNDYTRVGTSREDKDQLVSDDFDIGAAVQGATINHFRRGTYGRVYVSDDLRGLTSIDDIRLNQINIPRPQPGDTYEVLYADQSSADAERALRTGTVGIERIIDFTSIGSNEIQAKALSWQSYLFDKHIVGLYGIREDDTKSFGRADDDEVGFERRFEDGRWNPAYTRLSETPSLEESGETVTWSVVGRYPERWLGELPGGMDLQVQYAASENFNPIGLRSNALGEAVGQPTGTTSEYGFLASFAHSKYSIRVNWFETSLENIGAGVNVNVASTAYGRISSFRDAELLGRTWDQILGDVGLDASFPIQSFEQFYQLEEGNVPANLAAISMPHREDSDGDGVWDFMDYDSIQNLSSFASRTAEGVEIELVANPTPNWRVMANISQQQTTQDQTAPVMGALVAEYNQNMQADRIGELLNDPDGTVQPRTINSLWLQRSVGAILEARALDGTVSNEQREWRYNLVSNYEFDEGAFRGFSIGGAARWETEAATGYVFEFDEAAGVPVPNVDQPFFDDGLFSGDMWLSYKRRILENKVDWKIQLNVRNLIGESDDIPVKTNPDGRVAVVRIPNPRVFSLTNTFRF